MSINTPRRFYLLKRAAALAKGNEALASVWFSKQLEQPGVPLVPAFPFRARLAAIGYFAREDILGATADELIDRGLRAREAKAVIAAMETLT